MIPAMSDRRPTVDQPSTDRLTVAEAAARLGISSDAVRSRLNRGTLEGRKEANGWAVYLPAEPTVDQPSPTVERPSTDREPTVAPDALLASKDETIAGLRDEVAFLRRELETRTDELQRRDVLLREALERIPQLPSTVAAAHHVAREPQHATVNTEPAGGAAVPWWKFWERWG